MSPTSRHPRPAPNLGSIALGALLAVTTFGLAPISESDAAAKYRAAKIRGKTYYVSPNGSDSASGRTRERAWRTIRRANRARLHPGDGVLFRGGGVYSDAALMPRKSGRRGAADGVRLLRRRPRHAPRGHLVGPPQPPGLSGAARLRRPAVRERQGLADHRSGFNSPNASIAINTRGTAWTIRHNIVDKTGDSGIILEGSGHRVERNRVTDTGRDQSIGYGKHGIYMKASRTRVVRNVIRRFSAEGVSSRLRSGVVARNVISGGQVGVAWYQNDRRAGKSRWQGNRISSVSEAGMYISEFDSAGPTVERFAISGNVVSTRANFIDIESPGRVSLGCNFLRLGRSFRRLCSLAALAQLDGVGAGKAEPPWPTWRPQTTV